MSAEATIRYEDQVLRVPLHALQAKSSLFRFQIKDSSEYRIKSCVDPRHIDDFFKFVLEEDASKLTRRSAKTICILCEEFMCIKELEEAEKFVKENCIVRGMLEELATSDNNDTVFIEEVLSQKDSFEECMTLIAEKKTVDIPISIIYRLIEKAVMNSVMADVIARAIIGILKSHGEEYMCLLDLIDWGHLSAKYMLEIFELECVKEHGLNVSVNLISLQQMWQGSCAKLEEKILEVESKLTHKIASLEEANEELKAQNHQLQTRFDELEKMVKSNLELQRESVKSDIQETRKSVLDEMKSVVETRIHELDKQFQVIGSSRINLKAHSNLDDLLSPGNYKCPSNDDSPTIIGKPGSVRTAFILTVSCPIDNASHFAQELVEYLTGDRWYRLWYIGDRNCPRGWGDWQLKSVH